MIALLGLLCATPAHAGAVWLSGGLSATPTAGDLLTPSWRLGADAGRVKPWLTASYASFDTFLFETDLDGYVLLPRIGVRLDLAARNGKEAIPFVGVTGTTRIFGLTNDDDPWTEDAEAKGDIPFGVGLSGGLDAPVNDALSISAELGGEYYHLGYAIEDDHVGIGAFTTVASVYINLWL